MTPERGGQGHETPDLFIMTADRFVGKSLGQSYQAEAVGKVGFLGREDTRGGGGD